MTPPVSVRDYRKLAQAKLPRVLFDYLDSGAFNEYTLNENHNAYQRIQLNKRILCDVPQVDTSTEILGQKLAMPLILAPVGFAGMYARRGEVQGARAAEQAGLPFCLSTVSISSIEEVSRATAQPVWFQYYMVRDQSFGLELLKRAHAAHCPVLIFTVDVPTFGIRYRDMRQGLFVPTGMPAASLAVKMKIFWQFVSHPQWFWDVFLRGRPLQFGNFPSDLASLNNAAGFRISLTWQDLEWLRENWPGKLLLKGIMTADDARKAVSMGVDGIIVSNHAGRQFDSMPATIDVLPRIAEAVGGRTCIIIDGGIASGLDMFKALALGADACMIGRAWMYALAARGEQGVNDLLKMLRMEFENTMIQLGMANIKQIDL